MTPTSLSPPWSGIPLNSGQASPEEGPVAGPPLLREWLTRGNPETVSYLDALGIPELAFLLTTAAVVTIATWAAHPGLWWLLAGAVAFTGLGIITLVALPASAAGILFFATGLASLLMEVLVLPGFGLNALGGAFGLTLAGLYVDQPGGGAHAALVVPVALLAGAATFTAGRVSWRCIRDDPFAAPSRLVGREAVLLTTDGRLGHAVVGGQVWTVAAGEAILQPGQTVRVTAAAKNELYVEPFTRSG